MFLFICEWRCVPYEAVLYLMQSWCMSVLSQSSIDFIETKASDELLNTFNTATEEVPLPVNLGEIAKKNGLSLKLATFKDAEVIGYFDRSEKTIYVAKNMLLPRMAFTIAHELGHFILHEDVEQDTFLRLDTVNIDKQNPQQEYEANCFAAALLMPRAMVIQYWNGTRDVYGLAALFGVSRTAMLWRLKNIGLL